MMLRSHFKREGRSHFIIITKKAHIHFLSRAIASLNYLRNSDRVSKSPLKKAIAMFNYLIKGDRKFGSSVLTVLKY
ncbi:hypothetical protein [Kamptonema sp. UHCC 0994]|uniref:hypothetical protein n=1 Tax=Kamptonema sp. UHCC 0994 TaxID=3031329 RepID=UPI0023BA248F|nr:hypothetical protein [Kamptonema sp. UHCC 0994]MDF0555441.1 hypothetical protein [Kamptonema sp. UHCC 0994]